MTRTDSLPSDTAAEAAVLSSILIRPDELLKVEKILSARDFVSPWHREVYSAIVAQRLDGKPVDATLILSKLKQSGQIEHPAHFLAELGQREATAVHAEYYAESIKDKSLKRQLIELTETATSAATNGTSSGELIADLTAGLNDLQGGVTNRQGIETMSSGELVRSSFELTYAINQLLVEGQNAILAGPHKSMKTTFAVKMAVSLATGRMFLGRFSVPRPYRVCMMSGESGLAVIREIAIRCARFVDRKLEDIENLIWSQNLPRLGDARHMSELSRMLQGEGIEVVILDPAYLMMPGDDAGNLFKQGELLGQLNQVCLGNGATPVLVHHTKRTGIEKKHKPLGLDDLAWAGFSEFARQWITLNRREDYEPGTGCHRIWLNAGGSAGHGGLWGVNIHEGTNTAAEGRSLDIKVVEPDAILTDRENRIEDTRTEKASERIVSDKSVITKALAKTPDGDTKTGIRDRTSLSTSRVGVAIAALLEDEEVVPCGVLKGGRATPRDGFKLSEKE